MTGVTLRSGKPLPHLGYGTAIRHGKQIANTKAALTAGYRVVDTAGSTALHDQQADGADIMQCFRSDEHAPEMRNEDLFIQTKYVPPLYQGSRWYYNLEDPMDVQIFKTVLLSSGELDSDVIDALLLCAQPGDSSTLPGAALGFVAQIEEAWRAMEKLCTRGAVRYLGICGATVEMLEHLIEHADIKPCIVQNRFIGREFSDGGVRQLCIDHGIIYEVYGLFWESNMHLLDTRLVAEIAGRTSRSHHSVFISLVLATAAEEGLHMCILDGTRNPHHMAENLQAISFPSITAKDLERFRKELDSCS